MIRTGVSLAASRTRGLLPNENNKRELCISELKDVLKRIKDEQQARKREKSGFTNFEDEFACLVAANKVRYLLVDTNLKIRKANRAAIESSPDKVLDISGGDLIAFIRKTVVGTDEDTHKLEDFKNVISEVISDNSCLDYEDSSIPSLIVLSKDRRLFVINAVPISIDDNVHAIVAIEDHTENQRFAERSAFNKQQSALWSLVKTIAKENAAVIDQIRRQVEEAKTKLPKGHSALLNLSSIDNAALKLADLENLVTALGNRCSAKDLKKPAKMPSIDPIELVEGAISRTLVDALYDAPTSFPNIVLKPTKGDLPLLTGDERELGLCLDALLDNSIDATSATTSVGTICVSLSLKSVSGDSSLQTGEYLEITITDEGQGIPYHDLESVFEPLFTTKPQGRGMGLPLAASIAKRHGGAVKLVAIAEKGTRATLYLPVTNEKD